MDVMIVEDERIISLAVSRMVEGLGHRVLATIPSAEEALERLELLRPDLVLMDIHLQGPMDGIDACVAIHERWDIPCVYTSAYTDEATKVRASATKPLAFLGKPLSISSFTEIFEKIKAINPRSRGGGCLMA
ncbi:MAG: response regulator [Spirochaetota bacterium]